MGALGTSLILSQFNFYHQFNPDWWIPVNQVGGKRSVALQNIVAPCAETGFKWTGGPHPPKMVAKDRGQHEGPVPFFKG
jgi:hypothetical protein